MPVFEVVQGLAWQHGRLGAISRCGMHGTVVVNVQVMNLSRDLALDGVGKGGTGAPLVDTILDSFYSRLVCPVGDLDIRILQDGLHHLWLVGSLVANGPVVFLGEVCTALVADVINVATYRLRCGELRRGHDCRFLDSLQATTSRDLVGVLGRVALHVLETESFGNLGLSTQNGVVYDAAVHPATQAQGLPHKADVLGQAANLLTPPAQPQHAPRKNDTRITAPSSSPPTPSNTHTDAAPHAIQ